MAKTKVSIVKGSLTPTEREIEASVRKAVELIGGLADIVKPGNTVLIKPNLCVARPVESAAITNPLVVKAVAKMVKELGAKPIIGESTSIGADTEEAYKTGQYTKLREAGFEVIDLKKKGTETVKVPLPKAKAMKEVVLPKIVVDADVIISVPKMKTHDNALVTLSMKNMKGVLPDKYKRLLHHTYGVFQGIADLHTAIKPRLTVMDAIVGMEGFGPALGTPVQMGLIIAGRDFVAVDTVTTAVMGFNPLDDPIINIASKMKLGVADLNKIEVVGEPINKVRRRFQTCDEYLCQSMVLPEGFKLFVGEKTCTGCRKTVYEVLLDLKKENKLDETRGWCMVTGKVDKLPAVTKEKLLLVGVCTAKFRDKGVYVEGCAPNNRDLVKALGIQVASGVDIDAL